MFKERKRECVCVAVCVGVCVIGMRVREYCVWNNGLMYVHSCILRYRSMGLLSEGWVWMLTNDMSPAIRDTVKSQEELAAYDGLMFISGIWNRKCHTSPFKSFINTPISYTTLLSLM